MHPTPQALQTSSTAGISPVTSTRKVTAIRVPTLTPAGEALAAGHTYLMLPPLMSVRDLITEKVAAEIRKFRAGGHQQSTIGALLPDGYTVGRGPLDEQLATAAVLRQLGSGEVTIMIDELPVLDPDEIFAVTRRTSIAFIVASSVLA